MSYYCWELGSIVLPKAAWVKFRTAVIQSWNDHQQRLLDEAMKCYEDIKKVSYRRRNFDYLNYIHYSYRMPEHMDPDDFVKLLLKNKATRLIKPKKSKLDIRPLTRSTSMDITSWASIELENGSRRAIWDVGEGNRSVEEARAHPVAQTFFSELHKVKWTAQSGGQIVGNDEYNRDNEYAGGGGNYVSDQFGAKPKLTIR